MDKCKSKINQWINEEWRHGSVCWEQDLMKDVSIKIRRISLWYCWVLSVYSGLSNSRHRRWRNLVIWLLLIFLSISNSLDSCATRSRVRISSSSPVKPASAKILLTNLNRLPMTARTFFDTCVSFRDQTWKCISSPARFSSWIICMVTNNFSLGGSCARSALSVTTSVYSCAQKSSSCLSKSARFLKCQ